MYAKGMTTRQISETIEDSYGFEVSEGMVSNITDKLLPQIEEWQNRPLASVYPIVFIDAVHFSVRDEGVIKKFAAYVVLEINEDGKKEVLTIVVGEKLTLHSILSFSALMIQRTGQVQRSGKSAIPLSVKLSALTKLKPLANQQSRIRVKKTHSVSST